MARPKKEKALRHTHQIMLRLTDTEYEIISSQAKAANLPLAEFARRQIMNKRTILACIMATLAVGAAGIKKIDCRVWKNRK